MEETFEQYVLSPEILAASGNLYISLLRVWIFTIQIEANQMIVKFSFIPLSMYVQYTPMDSDGNLVFRWNRQNSIRDTFPRK